MSEHLTVKDFKSHLRPVWCPGCGDYGVLNPFLQALVATGKEPKNTVIVSGIGCSGRFPYFCSTYGFHGSEALSEYVGRVEVARTKWLQESEAILNRFDVPHRVITTLGTANKEILQHASANDVDLVRLYVGDRFINSGYGVVTLMDSINRDYFRRQIGNDTGNFYSVNKKPFGGDLGYRTDVAQYWAHASTGYKTDIINTNWVLPRFRF